MKNILKKCIEELSKENPKLDYIRGMLEVLVEQEDKPAMPVFTPTKPINPSVNPHGMPNLNELADKVLS